MMPTFAFSCVVDSAPVFAAQARIWVNCLKRLQSVDPGSIFVHVIGEQPAFIDWLDSEDVNIVEIEPFEPRHPYCNKLQQLATFQSVDCDQVALMDCDTAWVGDGDLPLGAPVAARIVDEANPSDIVLDRIFRAAGLGPPEWSPVWFSRGPDQEFTDYNNCNGGFYVCDRKFLAKLAPVWRRWALWSLGHLGLFGSGSMHVDQVSFALAMRQLAAKVNQLDLVWNYPLHIPAERLPDAAPQVVHYHDRLDRDLGVRALGLENVDRAIDKLNATTRAFPKRPSPRIEPPTAIDRPGIAAVPGGFLAGSGSPGRATSIDVYPVDVYKRGHTMTVVPDGVAQALELGCGGGHLTRLLGSRVGSLIATDSSEAALRGAAERCRERTNIVFRQLDFARERLPGEFDLVVAPDVFDGLASLDDLRMALDRIVEVLRPGGYLVLIEASRAGNGLGSAGFYGSRDGFDEKTVGDAVAGSGLVLEQELRTAAYRIQRFRRAPREAVVLPPLKLRLPLTQTPVQRL